MQSFNTSFKIFAFFSFRVSCLQFFYSRSPLVFRKLSRGSRSPVVLRKLGRDSRSPLVLRILSRDARSPLVLRKLSRDSRSLPVLRKRTGCIECCNIKLIVHWCISLASAALCVALESS